MASIEYAAFYSARIELEQLAEDGFDIFLSSFNSSERVRTVYDTVSASRKLWLVHAEYHYAEDNLPPEEYVTPDYGLSASEYWANVLSQIGGREAAADLRVAVDITGMMRPHILLLPYMLKAFGLSEVTVLYSDPVAYVSGERTVFAEGPVTQVGAIPGMSGSPSNSPQPADALIIGAGYDHDLISAVAEQKANAEHYLLFGLPSLQPHMYQESIIRADRASESLSSPGASARLFAPAHDPFATAQVISDQVALLRESGRAEHVYLSPVGPKSQVLGFAWYYWCEGVVDGASVLFPYSRSYSRETSRGIAAIHGFVLELDAIAI